MSILQPMGQMIGASVSAAISKGKREEKKASVSGGGARVTMSSSRAGARSAYASAGATPIAAPVNFGMILRGPTWEFGSAPPKNGLRGVRLSGRQIWLQVESDATPHVGNPLVTYQGSTQNSAFTFDPDDTATTPPPITSLAQVFGRYVLRKMRVVFTPTASTAIGVGLALAVNSDAAYVQSNWTGKTSAWATTLLEFSNSIVTPTWQGAGLDVPCDDSFRYIFQSAADGSLSTSEERQDHAFGLAASYVSGAGTALAAGTQYGYIHVDYVMDFYEVVSQTNEASLLRAKKRVVCLEDTLAKQRRSVTTHAAETKESKGVGSSESLAVTSPALATAALGAPGRLRRTDTEEDYVSVVAVPSGLAAGCGNGVTLTPVPGQVPPVQRLVERAWGSLRA